MGCVGAGQAKLHGGDLACEAFPFQQILADKHVDPESFRLEGNIAAELPEAGRSSRSRLSAGRTVLSPFWARAYSSRISLSDSGRRSVSMPSAFA